MECVIIKTIYAYNGQYLTSGISQIVRTIRQLQPDKPEDETQGFIAYNVPNKDRMKMKTGRFLVRKLGLQTVLPDTAIQRLASEINAMLFPGFGIRLDTGEDIYENYHNEVGGRSCMTGSSADCVRLYVDNPTRFSQLIIEQNGDSARAMVFHLDNGDILVGRVYATCEYLKARIKDYAESQGWAPRLSGTISGLEYTDGEIPFMDDLNQYRIDNNLLTIGTCLPSGIGVLNSQDGNLEEQRPCCDCGEHVDEDDCYSNENGELYCESCWHATYSYCDKCSHEVLREDIREVDGDKYWCESCADRHAYQCEECEEYSTDTITIDDNEYCQSCAERYPICEDCGEYVREANEQGHCEDCAIDHENEILCGAETQLLCGEWFRE